MNSEDMRFLLKKYMADQHIDDFKQLAKLTGIKYQTLLDHLDRPDLFRRFELRTIIEVLQISSEDQLKLI